VGHTLNFTKAAEEKNAENLLIIKEAYELVRLYETNIVTHATHARLDTPYGQNIRTLFFPGDYIPTMIRASA
jgi:hypothetical protein